MYYMIYVSQAKKPMDEAELELLLSGSREWNTAKNLTGLLIYRYSTDAESGHFIQMLEGDEREVRTLFEKILRDKRHHTILTFGFGEMESRMFSEWAMGFKNVDDALFAGLPGYARIGDASFNPAAFQQSNAAALDLLKFFHDACRAVRSMVCLVVTTRRTVDVLEKRHQARAAGADGRGQSHACRSHRRRPARHLRGVST